MDNIDFSPIIFKDANKEKIQREAYNKWVEKNFRGTLEIATGVGKTMLGIMAVLKHINEKILIVVPKNDIQKQWVNDLKNVLKIPESDIGIVGGGKKEFNKRIVVAIVNSLRNSILVRDLLIMDEMHRYASKENYKFIKYGMFKKILGLTATAHREDELEKNILQYAPIVFKFSQKDAIYNSILSKFYLNNMAISLTQLEHDSYKKLDAKIRERFPEFDNDLNAVMNAKKCGNPAAIELLNLIQQRKRIIMCAENKISICYDILKTHNFPKTIIFCEYITTLEYIATDLKNKGIECAKYHSKMSNKRKEEMLNDYKNDKYKIMIAVKSLDEGTNVPNCELGIITGGTSVERQMVQRLGRLLRTSDGKDFATVYQLYIPGTQDFQWMKKRIKELMPNAEKVRWL